MVQEVYGKKGVEVQTMVVSIIIPTYNEESFLSTCLDSLLSLNYPKEHFEIIVVDNGSTDHTREIAQTYGVKIIRDDSKNVSGLRNLGVTQARGDIIAFVDADCIVSKNWLKNASIYFDNLPIAAWGSPPIPPKEANWVQKTWFLVRQKEEQIQDVDWLESMNLFVRKRKFTELGGFNETLVTCEDADFSYKMRKFGKIVSDSAIEVIHLGEASTAKDFVKKEIWRGQGNLKGILSHGLLFKELPSLSIPFYFGIFLPVLLAVSIITLSRDLLSALVILYFLPSLGVLFKVRRKKIAVSDMLRLFFLIQLYFFSRTVAILKNTRKSA